MNYPYTKNIHTKIPYGYIKISYENLHTKISKTVFDITFVQKIFYTEFCTKSIYETFVYKVFIKSF